MPSVKCREAYVPCQCAWQKVHGPGWLERRLDGALTCITLNLAYVVIL